MKQTYGLRLRRQILDECAKNMDEVLLHPAQSRLWKARGLGLSRLCELSHPRHSVELYRGAGTLFE